MSGGERLSFRGRNVAQLQAANEPTAAKNEEPTTNDQRRLCRCVVVVVVCVVALSLASSFASSFASLRRCIVASFQRFVVSAK